MYILTQYSNGIVDGVFNTVEEASDYLKKNAMKLRWPCIADEKELRWILGEDDCSQVLVHHFGEKNNWRASHRLTKIDNITIN